MGIEDRMGVFFAGDSTFRGRRRRLFWGVGVALLAGVLLGGGTHAVAAEDEMAVNFAIDAGDSRGDLHPIWRFFGYDECNFTYMKYGKELLGELGKLGPAQVYIRCHHLMTSGDGTPGMKWGSTGMYSEDVQGNPVYNWTIVDRIFDTYLAAGVKPYVQIGFMPKDLSTRPDLYPTDISMEKRTPENGGQAYPPKDFNKWRELVRKWVEHSVEKYGKAEVEKWYWEVWNEPNILYWKGKPEEYFKLYDYAVDGVRHALPTARVGGPEGAGSEKFLNGFLEHCARGVNEATGGHGSPIDFISFHAKGSPKFVENHVEMGISNQLNRIDKNFGVVASFSEYKKLPIVIGESDPDGMAARPVSEAKGLGYRNTTLFSSYTAATLARTYELADKHGVNIEGALTWSFEFENKPYFAGYRVLATNGVDLPVLNVFRMFGKMAGSRIAVESSGALGVKEMLAGGVRGKPDVSAVAAVAPGQLSVLAWNYHDDDVAGPAAAIEMNLKRLPFANGEATVTQYRIDHDHSNAYTAWLAMGSPAEPSAEQYAQLKAAGQLAMLDGKETVHVVDGAAKVRLSLPRQGVALVVVQWR